MHRSFSATKASGKCTFLALALGGMVLVVFRGYGKAIPNSLQSPSAPTDMHWQGSLRVDLAEASPGSRKPLDQGK